MVLYWDSKVRMWGRYWDYGDRDGEKERMPDGWGLWHWVNDRPRPS